MEGDACVIQNQEGPEKLDIQSETHMDLNTTDRIVSSNTFQPRPRAVTFSRANVYYFTRQQGFSSVPERGGCSLGMSQIHFHSENYGAVQYCRIRRIEQKLQRSAGKFESLDSSAFCRGKRKRYSGRIPAVEDSLSPGDARRVPLFCSPPHLSPQRYDPQTPERQIFFSCATPPPPCLSPPKEKFSTPVNHLHSGPEYLDTLDTDSEASLDAITAKKTPPKRSRSKKKLMPIPPNVRARLLKQSGVGNIDESERWVCANLRSSRSRVGCTCITSPCDPASCACALDGVPCQVDKPGFPCNCDSTRCKNPYGHEEFSIARVRQHTAHVFERLAASGCDTPPATLSTCHGECPTCIATRPTFRQPTALLSPVAAAATVSSSGDAVVNQRRQQQNSTTPLSPLLPPPPPLFFGASSPVGVCHPTGGAVDGLINNTPVIPTGFPAGCRSTPTPLPFVKQSNPPAFSPPPAPKTPPSLTSAGGSFPTDAEIPSSKPFMPLLNARRHQVKEHQSTPALPHTELSLLHRLSLRKRRIVRSPYTPTRKRAAPRLHSTPTLASVLEKPVDSPAVSISPPLPVATVPSFRPLGGDLGCTSPIVGRSKLVVGQKATEADKKASTEDCSTTAVTGVCPPAKRPLATKDQLFDLNPPMCPPSSNPLGKLNGAC